MMSKHVIYKKVLAVICGTLVGTVASMLVVYLLYPKEVWIDRVIMFSFITFIICCCLVIFGTIRFKE
jgi:multisubunit Na+/H+ antiporter MnhF subunit